MPKKLTTNSKAVEARVRKEEKRRAELERIEKEKEDAYWKDDDKHVLRKVTRKEEREKKRQEIADRKASNKAVYKEEMESLQSSKCQSSTKMTRAQIATFVDRSTDKPKSVKTPDQLPIEENVNREIVEGEVARSVTEAIAILGVKESDADRHPEKRMKAAYLAFEEKNLPILKAENPNLRLSQIKQLLKKEWMKSPENPMNQKNVAYNSK
ncbi:hypothetical protein B4U79_10586 [Dinothrombium tinctorium]|uniref:HMG box domain-containing protein n=1 Tax=Dinothrombium tinctorium TaxID=1965070 RepID=A0A3S4REX3_9ACAR|nr:hypothetical protein B4U79_10586 [Dinothrombium tinctorium]